MARNAGATVFIGNLDSRVDERVLFNLMQQAGPLVDLYIPREKDKLPQSQCQEALTEGQVLPHRGYAFAEYSSESCAAYAVKLFSGNVRLFNRQVRFQISSAGKGVATVPSVLVPEPQKPSVIEDGPRSLEEQSHGVKKSKVAVDALDPKAPTLADRCILQGAAASAMPQAASTARPGKAISGSGLSSAAPAALVSSRIVSSPPPSFQRPAAAPLLNHPHQSSALAFTPPVLGSSNPHSSAPVQHHQHHAELWQGSLLNQVYQKGCTPVASLGAYQKYLQHLHSGPGHLSSPVPAGHSYSMSPNSVLQAPGAGLAAHPLQPHPYYPGASPLQLRSTSGGAVYYTAS